MTTPPAAIVIDARYVIDRELGRGAMGVVYAAHDRGLDRRVAVKLIAPELARDKEIAALFRREATALARVRSDHVVQVHAFGFHEGAPFFVMEHVEGADLEAIIGSYKVRGGVAPLHRAATILRQTARGLAGVHAHGIVHRDVKPSNVLVEARSGRPVLIDFGLALPPATGGGAALHAGLGTPFYMAPEQWVPDGTVTPATDVYAFGVTAFQLLTGAVPYTGETAQELMRLHASGPIPRVSTARPSISALDDVIGRALAKAPADRYADARELGQALDEAFAKALPRGVPYETPTPPSPSATVATAAAPLRALIVDDDESFRTFVDRALHIAFPGESLEVRQASSGESAVQAMHARMADLVVLDFDLPGYNGLETLSQLRALPGGNAARAVVVSGKIDQIGRWQFDLMGVEDFVAKPVAIRALAAALRAARSGELAPAPPSS